MNHNANANHALLKNILHFCTHFTWRNYSPKNDLTEFKDCLFPVQEEYTVWLFYGTLIFVSLELGSSVILVLFIYYNSFLIKIFNWLLFL